MYLNVNKALRDFYNSLTQYKLVEKKKKIVVSEIVQHEITPQTI